MSKRTHDCKIFKHVQTLVTVLCICSSSVFAAGIKRAPANFVPDDDMIVVPMVIERSFYDDFNQKHEARFKKSRKKLETWLVQEQYAKDYGLEDAGFIHLPTRAEKEKFFNRNYLRFIQKDVERSNSETLQGWVNSWTAEDEFDSIDNTELSSEYLVKAKKSRGQKVIKATETIKVGKKKFKIDIQPRLEMGMVMVKLKSDYINVRAWLGVNGKQEVYMGKKFRSTGTSFKANYYIDESRLLVAARQQLAKHWTMRFTHEKYSEDFDSVTSAGISENNILSVNFGMGF